MLVGCVGLAACGEGASQSNVQSEAPSSTDPLAAFADCVAPTYPGGTYIDENGSPASAPEPGPPPDRGRGQPSGPPSSQPAGDPEVPGETADRARTLAEEDRLLGPLLRQATLVDTRPWAGQHDQPIGVILDYKFRAPVDLPMGHGEIIDAGSEDMGTPGKYDDNGLPSKTPLSPDKSLPDTERAFIFVDSQAGNVYAAQPMNDLDSPC